MTGAVAGGHPTPPRDEPLQPDFGGTAPLAERDLFRTSRRGCNHAAAFGVFYAPHSSGGRRAAVWPPDLLPETGCAPLLPTGSAECAMFRRHGRSPSFVVAAVDSEVSRGGMRRRPETQVQHRLAAAGEASGEGR